MLAAVCLQTRQESWSYPEAVGRRAVPRHAVPSSRSTVLPVAVQAIGLSTPLTWWIEGVRQALFPGGISAIGGTGSLLDGAHRAGRAGPATIVIALLATGAVVTLAAMGSSGSERRAKDRGLLDQTTGS